MGIRGIVKRASEKVVNGIAKASSLSPSQLEEIQAERENYLSLAPNPNDPEAVEATARMLGVEAVEVYNAYLPQIHELYVPIDADAEYDGAFDSNHNIRFIHLTRWVSTKDENSLDKLVNVYEVLSNEPCNIALVFHRSMTATDVYLAVTDIRNSSDNVDVNNYMHRITEALRGNFPGSEWDERIGEGSLPCVDRWAPYSVAAVSNLPTEKSEKFVSQTIDKLLDGVIPTRPEEEYTLILLATPVDDARERQMRLGEIYSALAPMASWQTTYTYNESGTHSSQATAGVNLGVSIGSQMSQSAGTTDTSGVTDSDATSDSVTEGKSVGDTVGKSESTSDATGNTISGGLNLGFGIGEKLKLGGNLETSHSDTTTTTTGTSRSRTITDSLSQTFGKTLSKALSQTHGISQSVSKGLNTGANFGLNFARSSSVMAMIGMNEGINQTFKNYTVQHSLEQLEQQMKRIDQSLALGMWDFAAYVVSEDPDVANNVAHSYLALTQGEESFLSESAINVWRGDIDDEGETSRHICSYLRELRHPLFGLNPDIVEADPTYLVYPESVTATTNLSGKELAYSLNFPRKSVAGLPVFECAEFARNVSRLDDIRITDDAIRIGDIYHMHRIEPTGVDLSLRSLASHTFITGCTGAGKTNTTALILDRARREGVNFLVVEPAKGEYKDLFGSDPDVSVFGTNASVSPLLAINPFSFPHEIHVLEHLDRLVEIFNVCWPMYAAMPAVLKDAIQRSYEDCGWDMVTSENPYGDDLYPNFADVERNVREIIESSEYDSENKGAYKGSLITRLHSLCNGINGLIFTEQELSPRELFDANVIVDLSRLGSSETKSLIMGLLVLKLQEHRMAMSNGMNAPLRHLTVLEEAHNLLKRTSTEQPVEGGNLLGKSVEMLANAIAEMRAYGEGFIIADQAPGLLDLSVIRNTNTKIIMRLPDYDDRKLVGYAASLNDQQINELAKLPRGVAAVYQNDWIESVLCKIDRFDDPGVPYGYDASATKGISPRPHGIDPGTSLKIAELMALSLDPEDVELNEIALGLKQSDIAASMRARVLGYLASHRPSVDLMVIAPFMSRLFPTVRDRVIEARGSHADPRAMTDAANREVDSLSETPLIGQVRRTVVQGVILDYLLNELQDVDALNEWHERGGIS